MNEKYCGEIINFAVPVLICGLEGTGNLKMLTKFRLLNRKELAVVKKACETPVSTLVLREFLERLCAAYVKFGDALKRGVWHDTR